MVVGILLTGALLKPVFARPRIKKLFIPLSRKKEPAFHTFIEKLCNSLGSKTPTNIEVDCSNGTSIHYRRGLISLLEDEMTLTIGLPVISEMTIPELASLLAHEFGQQRHKTEMRLAYIITSINQWFSRVVFEQDVIDGMLDQWSLTTSVSITQIPISIAKFFIWVSRKILTAFMLAGQMMSRTVVRHHIIRR